jgi:sugar (pentulose or hexulose) kinase
MRPDTVLAVDLGTSWCKAAYVDRRGTIHAEGRVPSRAITNLGDGRLEAFWGAVVDAVHLASKQLPFAAAPDAIGISCRGLFGICLDEHGKGFIPSYDILAIKSSPDVAAAFRSPVWQDDPYAFGYTVRLAGLLAGLRRSAVEEWRGIQRAGALHDYIVYRLSGLWVTDPTTGPNALQWPAGLMQISGLAEEVFPEIRDYWDTAGELTPTAAEALDLPVGTRVVVGAHDGAAANIGTGAIHPGDACLTLGTNFAFRAVTSERPKTNCFGYVVAPGRWAWVNSVPGVATKLDCVATALLGESGDLNDRHRHLGNHAMEIDAETPLPPLVFTDIPSLLESVNEAQRQNFSDGAIYRSTLKTAAEKLRELVDKARHDGATANRYVATGGAVGSRPLLQILENELEAPVQVGHPEAGLLGTSMVTAIGAGWYKDLAEVWDSMTNPAHRCQETPALSTPALGKGHS